MRGLRLILISILTSALVGCGENSEEAKQENAYSETPWANVREEARIVDNPSGRAAEKLADEALSRATFPVLAPGDPAALERLELQVQSHLYSAIAVFKTHRVQVLGVRSGAADTEDELELEDRKAKITFTRWGVRYEVSIVCKGVLEPDPDLCGEAALVRELREDLVWINPR